MLINQCDKTKIVQSGIIFALNEKEKTAEVIGYDESSFCHHVLIPCSIDYNSQEFIVTVIKKDSFLNSMISSIQFPTNSKLKVIESKAFFMSAIESITIPSSVENLEEGWCSETERLTNIQISPDNLRYSYYDNKFIIGKTDFRGESYDSLIFARRDVDSVIIPSFIKSISSYSFQYCTQIEKVEFEDESQIQRIGKFAFSQSSIHKISISRNIKTISSYCFAHCDELKCIEIPENSNLRSIEKRAFFLSSIESLTITSKIDDLQERWCHGTEKLTSITISPMNKCFSYYENKFIVGKADIHSECFDSLIFSRRDIKEATIPSFIKEIDSCAFEKCMNLKSVKFHPNSELKSIGKYAFANSIIQRIQIPQSVAQIGKRAFSDCKRLVCIEIPENSELRSIKKGAFSNSRIESIMIPSKVEELDEGCFLKTKKLTKIAISVDNKRYKLHENKFIIGKSGIQKSNYDSLIFAKRDIEIAVIPEFIKCIWSYSFENCNKIKQIKVTENSELQIIGEYAFSESSIHNIQIPKGLNTISKMSFFNCKHLHSIEFAENSELKVLAEGIFAFSSIKILSIPAGLQKIEKLAFSGCEQLKFVDIPCNSELQIIEERAFFICAIRCFFIPPKMIQFSGDSFGFCDDLQIIEISENSNLQRIQKNGIFDDSNAIIMFPPRLKDLFN